MVVMLVYAGLLQIHRRRLWLSDVEFDRKWLSGLAGLDWGRLTVRSEVVRNGIEIGVHMKGDVSIHRCLQCLLTTSHQSEGPA